MDEMTGLGIPGLTRQALTLEEAARGCHSRTLKEAVRGSGAEAWFPTPQTTPVQQPPIMFDQRRASMAELPEFLTARQVADLLGVDEKTVTRWSLEDPSIPVLRRGRVVRFHRDRLMDWLQRQEPRGARRGAQRRPLKPVTE